MEGKLSISSEVSIEQVKSFWDKRPCNIKHSLREVGTKEYFDEVEARKYFVEPHIPRFAEFEKWKGKKVLEIGCGIGTDTINFARAGAKVTAVELSGRSLEVAKQRSNVFCLDDKISFYYGNAEELTKFVPVEPYDLIYSFGVIHHTLKPEAIIKEINFYTHSSSIIKIMVYHSYSWKVFSIILTEGKGQFWKIKELVAKFSEAQTNCPITYTFTKKEIRQMLVRNGFEVTEIYIDHIFPYIVSEYVNYRYKKEWYFRFMPNFLFRLLERNFGWHLCVTARR